MIAICLLKYLLNIKKINLHAHVKWVEKLSLNNLEASKTRNKIREKIRRRK